MRPDLLTVSLVICSLALPLAATEVPLRSHDIDIDGDLREWGQAGWIDIEPAGDGVGLRGVFPDDDHDATILVQWDAEALYVAAAVQDDTLDAGVIAPDEREWRGSGGQRKDRVFYFDHLKVFVREPGASAGYNLWFAPPTAGASVEESGPYWWGGRQRQAETVRPPVQVAGRVRGTTRTFEVAIPWVWMDAYPQSGDEFDAMFLFTDSDKPGDDVAVKIARKEDRWIWWQGKLTLTGTPAGLRPRPAPEKPLDRRPATIPREPLNSRVAEAIARSRQADEQAEDQVEKQAGKSAAKAAGSPKPAGSGPPPSAAASAVTVPAAGAPVAGGAVSSDSGGSATGSLRARLNRQLLARRLGLRAPVYWRDLERDTDLSAAQVDTFYGVLQRHLQRVVSQRVTSRIDFYVVDTATAAACRRDQSRKFVVDLLGRLSGSHDQTVQDWIEQAASQSRVDSAVATTFVREIAAQAGEVLSTLGITTSQELFKAGRRKSGLNEEDAYALAQALLGEFP